jgi:hypothetical protein
MKAIAILVALLASALAFAPPSSKCRRYLDSLNDIQTSKENRVYNVVALKRNPQLVKQYETKQDIAAEKLVWDPASGRFYEKNLDEVCEEEFCLMDTETKQPILLTRVSLFSVEGMC